MAATYGDLRHLLPGNYKRLITEWLEEDCPSFDYGGFVVGESEGEARLLGKSKVSFHYDSMNSRYTWMGLIYVGNRRWRALFRRGLRTTRMLVRDLYFPLSKESH